MNHDCKRYIEEYLIESGLSYTILQPTHFMDLFPIPQFVREKGDEVVYSANWNPEIEFSFVALRDLGEAAEKVLVEREKHFAATYPVVGTEGMSYNRACKIAGELVGKKIVVKQKGFEEAVMGFFEDFWSGG